MDLGAGTSNGIASGSADLGGLHVHIEGTAAAAADCVATSLVLAGGLVGTSPAAAAGLAHLGGSLKLHGAADGSGSGSANLSGTHVVVDLAGTSAGHALSNSPTLGTANRPALVGSSAGHGTANTPELTVTPAAHVVKMVGHSGAVLALGSSSSNGIATTSGTLTITGVPNVALASA